MPCWRTWTNLGVSLISKGYENSVILSDSEGSSELP